MVVIKVCGLFASVNSNLAWSNLLVGIGQTEWSWFSHIGLCHHNRLSIMVSGLQSLEIISTGY